MCNYSTVENNFGCFDPKFDYFYHQSLLNYLHTYLITYWHIHSRTYFLAYLFIYLFIYLLNYFLIYSHIRLHTSLSTLFFIKFLPIFFVSHVHLIAILHTQSY